MRGGVNTRRQDTFDKGRGTSNGELTLLGDGWAYSNEKVTPCAKKEGTSRWRDGCL